MSGPGGRAGVLAALVLVQVLFGVHYLAAKVVVTAIPPRAWAGIRVGAAALFLLPAALLLGGRRRIPTARDLALLAGLSVLGVVINQWCFVEGLSRTTVSHSALINCSIPVLTLVFAMLLGHERPGPGKVASIALALAGVLALLRVDSMVWDTVTQGDILTLVNATSFSLFLVLSRPVLARLDALAATAFLFVFGAAVLLPLGAGAWSRIEPARLGAEIWLWGGYIVLGATVLAYTLNYVALRRVESSVVALFIFLQPLLAAILDVWVLGSAWSDRLTAAALAISAGVTLALRGGGRRPVTPLPRGG